MTTFKLKNPKWIQPLDRIALALMLLLTLLMALLAASGNGAAPRVRDFSWQHKQVGAEDNSFILTFTRPMDHASVQANLRIEPLLQGKMSWAGRKMAYTLNSPAPYGMSYKVKLEGARDFYNSKDEKATPLQPFSGSFQTRDQAFVYQGVEGAENGRLILYNLTKQQKIILTPENMLVMDFKPFPAGDRILYSAIDSTSQKKGLLEQRLYTVTTGLNSLSNSYLDAQSAGRVNLVLDNQDYQNLKFDLAADGQTIAVQRANRRHPGEFGLWILKLAENQNVPPTAQPLGDQSGGDFLITPDSSSVAILQGQGVAILPLMPKAKPLDFLPKYGMVLGFAKDSSVGAMVKFNTDNPQLPTRSLFLVPNQSVKPGIDRELLSTTGSILGCQFDPTGQTLYCLLTQLLPGVEYQEQPYLAAIDLKTSPPQIKPLLVLPNQRDIQMSVSPDGLALLFDQIVTSPQASTSSGLTTNEGQPISTSRLWMLPLVADGGKLQPYQLPLPGLHPHWLP